MFTNVVQYPPMKIQPFRQAKHRARQVRKCQEVSLADAVGRRKLSLVKTAKLQVKLYTL